jgi:hypothetical protein
MPTIQSHRSSPWRGGTVRRLGNLRKAGTATSTLRSAGGSPRFSQCVVSLLLVALAALPAVAQKAPATDSQSREVKLEQTITAKAGGEPRELFIEDGKYKAKIKALYKKEKKLIRMEDNLAADLGGGLDKLARATEEEQKESWFQQTTFYKAVAGAAGMAGSAVGFLEAEVPSLMNLYWFCSRVSREIDVTASERQELEEEYFRLLAGGKPKEGEDAVTAYFELGEGSQKGLSEAARARLLDIRLLRQNTLENLLLAMRKARMSGLPTAVAERTMNWATTDVSQLEWLKQDLKMTERQKRRIQAAIEQKDLLIPQAKLEAKKIEKDKLVIKGKSKADALKDANAKVKALEKQKERGAALLKKKEKQIKDLKDKIDKAKVGLDPMKKGRKVAPRNERAEKAGEIAAPFSSTYAALTIRRRIHMRATREAQHLYGLVEKFAITRRTGHVAKQREKIYAPATKFDPKKLRKAYIDQGLAVLAKNEMQGEDAFLGQVDYFNALGKEWEKFGGEMKGGKGTKAAQYVIDSLQTTMHLFSGMATAYMDSVKWAVNSLNIIDLNTELDKVHNNVRKKREEVDQQVDLLKEAVNLTSGSLAGHFGVDSEPTKEAYKIPEINPKSKKDGKQAFKEDRAFYDALDGGVRRIVSAGGAMTRKQRLDAEYLIAYEKACYTYRDLGRMQRTMSGLDAMSGKFSPKLFLSPVRTIVAGWRLVYEKCDPLYGPRQLEISAWTQSRGEQVNEMRLLYQLLAKTGFSMKELIKLRDAGVKNLFRMHSRLYREHPDYMRFWHKAEQEDIALAQAKNKQVEKIATNWISKSQAKKRTEVAAASAPSAKYLANAHLQDAFDQMQVYDFTKSLSSLIAANGLDHNVVGSDYVDAMEAQMGTWTAVQDYGEVATKIGDAIIWHFITQGMTGSVQLHVGGALGIKQAAVKTLTFSDKIWGGVRFLWGQVNPMRGIISFETIVNKGLAQAVKDAAWTTLKTIREDAIRDEFLLKRAKMDPDIADKISGLLWNAVDEATGLVAKAAHDKLAQTRVYKQASLLYYTRQLQTMQKSAPSARSINKVLNDPKSWFFQRWQARRQTMAIAAALELQQKIDGLRLDLGVAAVKATRGGQDDPDPARAPPKRSRLVELLDRMEVARVAIDGDVIEAVLKGHNFDIANARKAVTGQLGEAARKKVVEEAGALLRVFDGRFAELRAVLADDAMWGNDKGRIKDALKQLDLARRTLHFETFNYLSDVVNKIDDGVQGDMEDVLGRADAFYHGRAQHDPSMVTANRPSKKMTKKRLKELLGDFVGIVPTGSGGYIDQEGGEYKQFTSDLDYTVVIKQRLGGVTADERVILECVLQSCFTHASGGLDPSSFDMAFMVDDRAKFTGETSVMKSPADIAAELRKPPNVEYLKQLAKEHDDAISSLLKDASHGERYLTLDRIQMLVYLNSLGQDILYRDKNGKLVKAKKADLLDKLHELPEDVQALVKNDNAKLNPSNAVGIIADDAAMLYKHLPGIEAGIDKTGLDRKPFDDYAKELDKRAIRIMVGFLCTHPEGLAELNKLPGKALKGGKVDHSTFCDITLGVIKKIEASSGKQYGAIREVIEGWQGIKMGKFNADDLVRQKLRIADGTALPDPSSGQYKRAFESVVADTMKVVDFMVERGVQKGAQEMAPLFKARKRLQGEVSAPGFAQRPALEQEQVKAQLDVANSAARLKLTGIAALHDKLGPQQKTIMDALKSVPDYDDKLFKECMDEVKKTKRGGPNAFLPRRLWRFGVTAPPLPLRRAA